jgi:ABC-2 type transport system permease protein
MANWTDVFRAQLFSSIAWYKNNRFMFFSMFVWPYIMVGMIYALGTIYGDIEQYTLQMGISNPALYLFASSVVAMSSLFIVDAVAGFTLWNRWLGTLPYIILSPVKTSVILIVAGLPDSLISPVITMLGIVPAVIYYEGIIGAAKTLLVLLIIFLGMLPMLGFASLFASLLLVLKEESNILSSLSPFILLASGVFYPIEILPRILQAVSEVVPTRYVIDASKLVSTYLLPEARPLLLIIYAIAILGGVYNLLALSAIGRAERRVKKVGAI